jgi:hypothetical protein
MPRISYWCAYRVVNCFACLLSCVCAQLPLQPTNASAVGWYVESRADVFPFDLWTAMSRARGRPLPTPVPTRFSGPGYGCLADGSRCCRNATTGCPLCPAGAGKPSVLWGCNVSDGAIPMLSVGWEQQQGLRWRDQGRVQLRSARCAHRHVLALTSYCWLATARCQLDSAGLIFCSSCMSASL